MNLCNFKGAAQDAREANDKTWTTIKKETTSFEKTQMENH